MLNLINNMFQKSYYLLMLSVQLGIEKFTGKLSVCMPIGGLTSAHLSLEYNRTMLERVKK